MWLIVLGCSFTRSYMKDYLTEFEPPEPKEENEWIYIIGSGILFGWMVGHLIFLFLTHSPK